MKHPAVIISFIRLIIVFLFACLLVSCADPDKQARQANEAAYQIIERAQLVGLDRTEPFSVERPSDTLRRRLFTDQDLAGVKRLSEVSGAEESDDEEMFSSSYTDSPYVLSLLDALQAGAQNSREYQNRKESLFKTALDLDLEANEFRHSLTGLLGTLFQSDQFSGTTVSGLANTAQFSLSKKFETGIELTTRIGIDLVKLLTQGKSSSMGIWGDATILIPMLRGAGREVVREPLTQAERNVLYEIYGFEQYKADFAADLIRNYLQVLQTMDQVRNTEENYYKLEEAVVRSRGLAEAGRLPDIQVAQAMQDGLRARDNWLRLSQSYARQLDSFKQSLGLPPDARIRLDQQELTRLSLAGFQGIPSNDKSTDQDPEQLFLSPDDEHDEIVLNDRLWLEKALANRLDLRIEEGGVADAGRKVKVAADGFLPGLDMELKGTLGDTRPYGSFDLDDARFRLDRGRYIVNLNLDSPFNKTSERIAYLKRLLALDQAIRNYQRKEDDVKLEVRNQLRSLFENQEQVSIQEQALEVARWRVAATEMLLQSGRIEMRDLLDARDSLVAASDDLTAARMNYRLSELELMRDAGMLRVSNLGLFPVPPKKTFVRISPIVFPENNVPSAGQSDAAKQVPIQ